eukprot:g6748.t1
MLGVTSIVDHPMEAGLQKNFDIPYNCGRSLFIWEPLSTTYGAADFGSHCSVTDGHNSTNPGYWFVKFKNNTKQYVSKIRLWSSRDTLDCINAYGPHAAPLLCPQRLSGACVRFSSDGSVPDKTDPAGNCDMYLPDIGYETGVGTGTDVPIKRSIAGMLLIAHGTNGVWAMQVCGVKIYREDAKKMHTFDNGQLERTRKKGGEVEKTETTTPTSRCSTFGIGYEGLQKVRRAAASALAITDKVANERGWWSVSFADGVERYVLAVKLWNRHDCCMGRLSFAEVFFDGNTERAFRLPNIAKSGTLVDISRKFTTFKIRNDACKDGAVS